MSAAATAIDLLFLALVALQVADFVTTQRAFALGAVEANPLLAALQRALRSQAVGRWVWLAAPKLAIIGALFWAHATGRLSGGAVVLALFVLSAWHLWVVLHNVALIKALKRGP